MDNGILQREQAEKVKLLVSQTRFKKGRRQELRASQPQLASPISMRSLSIDSGLTPATLSPNPVDRDLDGFYRDDFRSADRLDYTSLLSEEHFISPVCIAPDSVDPQFGASIQSRADHEGIAAGFSDNIELQWSLWPSAVNSVTEPTFSLENYTAPHFTPLNYDSVQPLPSPDVAGARLVTTNTTQNLQGTSEMDNGVMVGEGIACSTMDELQSGGPRNIISRLGKAATHDHMHIGNAFPVPSLIGGTEDVLFMHYLDQVFHVQYPFYLSQSGQGRGWLFSILKRVKSAYHATLAMSERHLHATSAQSSDMTSRIVQLRTHNSNYDIAIQELEIMIKDISRSNRLGHLVPSLEVLMSLLQIFFFEVCYYLFPP
jgi:hypothetical protein